MFNPVVIDVTQTIRELRILLSTAKYNSKHDSGIMEKKVKLLMSLKLELPKNTTKRKLAKALHVNPNTIQRWKDLYVQKGIIGLLQLRERGVRSSIFGKEEIKKIDKKLKETKPSDYSFNNLYNWIISELKLNVSYDTANKYVNRNFQHRLKHIKKYKR